MTEELKQALKQLEFFIKQRCRPFLDDLEKCRTPYQLIRGEKASSLIEIRKCPVNRRPRNTRPIYHRAADQWFLDSFGVRYRSNSLFCTTDAETAEIYGNVRRVYPIGDYAIGWSPNVYDMYFATTTGQNISDFVGFLNEANYRHGKVTKEALESQCEIMLHCEAYVSVDFLDCSIGFP